MPVTDTEFSQSVNPQNFCTGVSLHHQALIQNSGPLIDMSDIRPGTSMFVFTSQVKHLYSEYHSYLKWLMDAKEMASFEANAV